MKHFFYLQLALGLISIFAAGCGKDAGVADATNDTTLGLCKSYYRQCVDPIFYTSLTRTDGAVKQCIECHRGGPGKSFQLSTADPSTEEYWLGSYQTAHDMALEGANSKILLKPLGLLAHGGGQFFTSASDVNYVIINKWLSNPDPLNATGDFDYAQDTAFCRSLHSSGVCP